MTKYYYCIGCCERKPVHEMKDYRGDFLCKTCRNSELISEEFADLENKELELADKIVDAESLVSLWEDNLNTARSKVQQAREAYRKNELAITYFDWKRWVMDEPKEDVN